MTQAEVAERLGKPQSFVAKYEGGHRRLQLTEFLSVADAIGFDAAYVIRNLALAERRPIARTGPNPDLGVH